jgi:EF-P beta-lysylation protein EpmB
MADAHPWPTGEWRQILAGAMTGVEELLGMHGLDPSCQGGPAAVDAEDLFAFRVPPAFAARAHRPEGDDGILPQVLPHAAEMESRDGFTVDPVGELAHPPRGGLLQKYRGRALVMVTGACAVHCRYCFRRHFPYEGHTSPEDWRSAVETLAGDPSISEVILSGGDPLTVPDARLARMVADLWELRHLRRLRVHTRMPIVLPQRVDRALVRWLAASPVPLVVVVHVNHPSEIDADVERGLSVLDSVGVRLLNQSVLLRGVNDDAAILAELSEKLFDVRVTPYYLHMLDPVAGAAHFEVPETRALQIMGQLREVLPGYLVPRLVREIPGAPSKVPVELQD